jgi:dihydroflavonol-4-reductase
VSTIFVTGGTGLTGANVCQQLIERGDDVRALVRNPDEATALAAIGVELVQGDIAEADDVLRAAKGCEATIHTAALLGGSSQDLADFEAVNMVGTTNVLDAGLAHGMRRVVALSTGTFFDLSAPGPPEEAPLLDDPPDDPYTVTKLAAFREVHARAATGEDVLTCHPGAIYGPSPVARRALHPTSFNAILLASLRGRIPMFLDFPVTWVAAADVAWGSIAALDRGEAGGRYWLVGRPEDTISTAAGCNRACELAGVDHRVEDLDYRSDPEGLTAAFGPTLMAIAEAAANTVRSPHSDVNPTRERLGYHPMSLDEGLGLLIPWLRELGKI